MTGSASTSSTGRADLMRLTGSWLSKMPKPNRPVRRRRTTNDRCRAHLQTDAHVFHIAGSGPPGPAGSRNIVQVVGAGYLHDGLTPDRLQCRGLVGEPVQSVGRHIEGDLTM